MTHIDWYIRMIYRTNILSNITNIDQNVHKTIWPSFTVLSRLPLRKNISSHISVISRGISKTTWQMKDFFKYNYSESHAPLLIKHLDIFLYYVKAWHLLKILYCLFLRTWYKYLCNHTNWAQQLHCPSILFRWLCSPPTWKKMSLLCLLQLQTMVSFHADIGNKGSA